MLTYIGILLLGLMRIQTTQAWQLSFAGNQSVNLHLDDVIRVPFELVIPEGVDRPGLKFDIENTDHHVVSVKEPWVESLPAGVDRFNSSLNITGLFLGKADIVLKVTEKGVGIFVNYYYR